jgi:endonuclease/exonuclease/phosphatase family metal-dependent hydrolase
MTRQSKVGGVASILSGLAMIVALSACNFGGADGEENLRRGGEKADGVIFGSCESTDCGGPSLDGNCFCDESCAEFGDCCSDKVSLCGGQTELEYTTYNLGLVDAVGLREQRIEPLVDALRESTSDVICMQEVWSDEDATRISEALADVYPHALREVTKNDDHAWFACSVFQVADLFSLNSCTKDKCIDEGISLFECIKEKSLCADEYDELPSKCQFCISANTSNPASCVYGRTPRYANDGRNGLLMLSKHEIEEPQYTAFDTQLIKRGILSGYVAGNKVQCTHMTADLSRVPYPDDAKHSSWKEEHLASIDVMENAAGDGECTVLMGDLNSGIEDSAAGLDAELADNFQALEAAGFRDQFEGDDLCTHCADNPLVGGTHSSRIDHVLMKGCDDRYESSYSRVYEDRINVQTEAGNQVETALSDHYGISVVLRER